jgi:hypothetical protein
MNSYADKALALAGRPQLGGGGHPPPVGCPLSRTLKRLLRLSTDFPE